MARNLAGHQTPDGFLVLTPHAPLTLTRTDSPDGQFGADAVGLIFRPCQAPVATAVGRGFQVKGSGLCFPRIPLDVSIPDNSYFQSLRDQLEITVTTGTRK